MTCMAMQDYRVPTLEEAQIISRNGIDPDSVAVVYRDETTIRMLCYTTRDTITLHQGDKKW